MKTLNECLNDFFFLSYYAGAGEIFDPTRRKLRRPPKGFGVDARYTP